LRLAVIFCLNYNLSDRKCEKYLVKLRNGRHLNIFFFLSEFGFNPMCHNPMRSIILESVPESQRIMTYHVETKFKKKKKIEMSSISQ